MFAVILGLQERAGAVFGLLGIVIGHSYSDPVGVAPRRNRPFPGPVGAVLGGLLLCCACRSATRAQTVGWSAPALAPADAPASEAVPGHAAFSTPDPDPEAAYEPLRLPAAGTTPPGDDSDEAYEWKRFAVSIGAQLIASVNTTLRVDSPTLGIGTEVDFESDFDVDDRLFFGRIDAEWRFARKHSLDFSIFDLKREGTRVTDRDIQIGDVVFPVDTRVTNESELLVVKLAYRYAFLSHPRWHMGASLGAHAMDWDTEWRTGSGLALEEDFGVLVPLPVVGLFGSVAITPKLYLNASSEFFGLKYDNFDGFLNNTRLNLEHRTFKHVGFGIGLDYFRLDASVESDNGNLEAEAKYDYVGLVAFMRIF